jgi:hypothetical protein
MFPSATLPPAGRAAHRAVAALAALTRARPAPSRFVDILHQTVREFCTAQAMAGAMAQAMAQAYAEAERRARLPRDGRAEGS